MILIADPGSPTTPYREPQNPWISNTVVLVAGPLYMILHITGLSMPVDYYLHFFTFFLIMAVNNNKPGPHGLGNWTEGKVLDKKIKGVTVKKVLLLCHCLWASEHFPFSFGLRLSQNNPSKVTSSATLFIMLPTSRGKKPKLQKRVVQTYMATRVVEPPMQCRLVGF